MLFRCKNCRSICHVYGLSASFPHKEILKYKSTKHTKYREYQKMQDYLSCLLHPCLTLIPSHPNQQYTRRDEDRALAIFETIKTQCGCAVALWLLVVCMCWFSRVMDRAVKLASHTNSYCCYNNISTGWITYHHTRLSFTNCQIYLVKSLFVGPRLRNKKFWHKNPDVNVGKYFQRPKNKII